MEQPSHIPRTQVKPKTTPKIRRQKTTKTWQFQKKERGEGTKKEKDACRTRLASAATAQTQSCGEQLSF
jgi:hypothetical protein